MGGRTGRGDVLRLPLEVRDCGRSRSESDWEVESGLGDEPRRLEEAERGVAEKDCSKGLGSRSKSERVWRVLGRRASGGGGDAVDEGDLLLGDILLDFAGIVSSVTTVW